MERLYIQKSSSTLLLRGSSCISLVPLPPSTWGEAKISAPIISSTASHRLLTFIWRHSRSLVLDASLDGLRWGAAGRVHAVCAVVLLVIQEPAGVRKAAHLDPGVTQALKQLRHTVDVEEDAGAPRATCTHGTLIPRLEHSQRVGMWSAHAPASRQKQHFGVVQALFQKILHHFLDDQRAHEGVATYTAQRERSWRLTLMQRCVGLWCSRCLTLLRFGRGAAPHITGAVGDEPGQQEQHYVCELQLGTKARTSASDAGLHHVGVPPVRVFFGQRGQDPCACRHTAAHIIRRILFLFIIITGRITVITPQ